MLTRRSIVVVSTKSYQYYDFFLSYYWYDSCSFCCKVDSYDEVIVLFLHVFVSTGLSSVTLFSFRFSTGHLLFSQLLLKFYCGYYYCDIFLLIDDNDFCCYYVGVFS